MFKSIKKSQMAAKVYVKNLFKLIDKFIIYLMLMRA